MKTMKVNFCRAMIKHLRAAIDRCRQAMPRAEQITLEAVSMLQRRKNQKEEMTR